MENLIFSLALILGGLMLGYLVQKLHARQRISLPSDIVSLRKSLQKLGLLAFMPISFLGAVWIVPFSDLRIVWLPIIGIVALLSGGILGIAAAKMLKVPREQIGVMYCCGSFTNIGAIGSLVCFMLLGEAGFALVALYKMFEEISYYTIGFPIARYYGGSDAAQKNLLQRAAGVVRDPFVATVLSAFIAGLFLNLSGIDRPFFMEKVTAFCIPAGTFVLLVSIGLGMRFSSIGHNMEACASVAAIKFLGIPLIASALAYLVNLHLVADGLPFKVVLVLSSMPVAFNALVAASIFDLDLDLANSVWLITTGLLVIILPLLYFLLRALPFL